MVANEPAQGLGEIKLSSEAPIKFIKSLTTSETLLSILVNTIGASTIMIKKSSPIK